MRSLYVPLPPEALEALYRLAERNQRNQRQQAAYLILEGLERRQLGALTRDHGDEKTAAGNTEALGVDEPLLFGEARR